MNKLVLVSVAALAASLPALASAQPQTVSPPVPWEEVPNTRMNMPGSPLAPSAAPGVTWQQRAPRAAMMAPRAPAPPAAPRAMGMAPPAAMAQVRGHHGGGGSKAMMRPHRPVGGVGGMHHVRPGMPSMGKPHVRMGGGAHHMRGGGGHHVQRRFHHIPRIGRGGSVHRSWWGPQFHVRNWGLYGFPAPLHNDWRWVRHYDDAYLIDRDGRVQDERYGLDWDGYGERWDYDERGAPAYGGGYEDDDSEDYGFEDEGDDRYAEGWDEEDERGYDDEGAGYGHHQGGYAHGGGGCQVTYSFDSRHPAPPPPPPPCAHGYGYGGGMVVTETTVTTAPTVTEHVVYEDVVTHKVRKHKPKRKYKVRHSAPPPPAYDGERG